LIRGGGSHSRDIDTYKDAIINIMNDYPEYNWAFMGYWPKWALETLPDERLLLFPYGDLMKYFETLMELKPEIMIVPLEDTEFNKSKSNIAWIEGTLAGAITLAPDLPEFIERAWIFSHQNQLEYLFKCFVTETTEEAAWFHRSSLMSLPRLSEVNELRKDEIERLAAKPEKFLITPTENKIATNKEFFNHCLTHGHLQDNEAYQDLHSQALGQLHGLLDFKTVVEFGCGPGYTLELLNYPYSETMAFGMELNPYFIEYFRNRNPHLADYIAECDFIKDPIELDEPADLGISIEVFEHINQTEEEWDKFIENLSKQFKHFYFSSTPFRDKPSYDLWWGHINIRTTTSWIKLFEKNGWELVCRPGFVVGWDVIFKSKNV
jgi:SAM-dependent methyltransferase